MENKDLPFISCKCITYGRIHLLEEAVKSFLIQDYPSDKCELIIVNDYSLQKIIFDHPQIKIFNLDTVFETLGDKENFATEQCKGDIIHQWDDDDVALSNHFRNVAKYWKEDTFLIQWHCGILYNEPEISAITGLGNAGMVYSKKAWEAVGKYKKENAGHDMTFLMSIRIKFPNRCVSADPINDEVSYLYMWGGRGYHASGQGTDTPDRQNVIVRHQIHIEGLRAQGLIPTGDIILAPNWKKDYKQLLIDYNNKNQK